MQWLFSSPRVCIAEFRRDGYRQLALICVLATACAGGWAQSSSQPIHTSSANHPITLKQAVQMARAYSPQLQKARTNAELAHEQSVQAKAARLPSVNALNQYIYTEGNNTASGVFIANDGVHVYNEQAVVKEDLLSLVRGGQMKQARAAEAAAQAQQEIARRGLVVTVAQHYYAVVAAQQKIQSAQQSLTEAKRFIDITEKQEKAGIVSHMDVVKAEMDQEQRARDLRIAQLAADQAKLTLAVMLFPRLDEPFTLNEPAELPPLPALAEARRSALEDNPDIHGARAGANEAQAAVSVARYGYLPSLATTFYYGIDANQLAIVGHDTLGTSQSQLPNTLVQRRQNLGYAADITLDIPLWNWGTTRSKVRAAESSAQLAKLQASTAERQLEADIQSFYEQAKVAREQVDSLTRSRSLAEQNLHLTLLRYQSGEATALEAVSAETSLADARASYADGLTQYYMALAQLETLTGNF